MVANLTGGFACGFLLLAVATGSTVDARHAQQAKVTPVEKVIELLKKLETQIEEEGKTEAAQYDKTACFCKEQADDKLYAIETSREKIKQLNAQIEELETLIAELNGKITELSEKISDLKASLKALVAARAKAHTHYAFEAKDMDDAISAMERAIKALKDSKGGMTDAKTDFVQLRSSATTVLHTVHRSSRMLATDTQL